MNNLRYKLSAFLLNHRAISILAIFLFTVFFGIGAKDTQLKTIFSDLLPKNHEFVKTYKDHPNFGNPLTVTVMVKVQDGDIYNYKTLQKIWDLTKKIDLIPGIDHDQLLSISTEKARYSEAVPGGIESYPLMGDAPPSTPDELTAFKNNVDKSPNSKKFLISHDQSATLIKATFIERLLDYGTVFDHLNQVILEESDDQHQIYVAGQPVLTGWVYRYEAQMLWIFGLTALGLLLSLVFYMKNIAGVVVPLVTSFVAAVWGFGFVGWLGLPIEPLIMVVPLLLVARSFSHSVQFIERYYEVLFHVKNKQKAAEISLSVMMAPGVLGIITDAAGLFLIAIAPIPAMERFALFCGFWAFILIPTGVFLAPLLLSYLPEPRNAKQIIGLDDENAKLHNGIKHLLHKLSLFSFGKRAKYSAAVFLSLFVISLSLALNIKIGNPVEGSNLLWDDSEYNTAVRAINAHFPGLNTLEIVFEAKDPKNPQRVARQADTIFAMSKIQRYLESEDIPPVATLSFADYLPEANRLFSGGNPKWSPLDYNDTSVNAAANAVLFGTSPKAFSHVTDFVQQNATVSLWFKDNKQETVDLALSQARAAIDSIGNDFDDFIIRLGTGTIALQQSINDIIDLYQWYILGALNLVILVCCGFAYKSLAAGILLMIPVNFSNILLAACMYLMGIGLDVNTLPIAAIGIGVGIDYGIYLLSRICEEYQEHEDYSLGIVAAVSTTGKAIFFTASIVLIGILPWYFLSDLKFLADMGLLLVLVMLINMLIALMVIPLLVWIFKPNFVSSKDLLVGEGVDLNKYASGCEAFV